MKMKGKYDYKDKFIEEMDNENRLIWNKYYCNNFATTNKELQNQMHPPLSDIWNGWQTTQPGSRPMIWERHKAEEHYIEYDIPVEWKVVIRGFVQE